MSHTIAILGGGVAGLSAAHELVQRGFQVSVYERKDAFGGKARSVSGQPVGGAGLGDLPGEHGFRFFPGFYRHLPDTMSRIPYGTRTVAGNLVESTRILVARAGLPPSNCWRVCRRLRRLGSRLARSLFGHWCAG